MPAVRQRKEEALGSQRRLIDSHEHLNGFHRVVAASLWRAIAQDFFKPIVHEPGVGLGETLRCGRHVQGLVVGDPAQFS